MAFGVPWGPRAVANRLRCDKVSVEKLGTKACVIIAAAFRDFFLDFCPELATMRKE
jgi:hypothetical protein